MPSTSTGLQLGASELNNTLTDNALSAVKSTLASASSTPIMNIDGNLLQSMVNAVKISPFVAGVINNQPKAALIQTYWHSSHSDADFSDHLSVQLNGLLIKNDGLFSGRTLKLIDFLPEFQSGSEMMKFLRTIRYQHTCAIAVLELNNELTIENSSARMSVLAEQLTLTAYLWSYAYSSANFGSPQSAEQPTKPQNMLILAMGKFGGNELNFSSDIDLIFFYINDGETVGGKKCIANNKFFKKVSVLLIKLLDEVTQDGFVFRVDMRLRPYGNSGNLIMSVAQAEDYYQEQGREWERFAMVRARIISGRAEEVSMLEDIIKPFAFRRYIDYGVIDSLRNMKEMIQREVRRRGLKGNIKLGAGGIREIEFMVQSLQLIQGGRNKQLQQKNLLKALPLLVSENLLAKAVAKDLKDNYRFLRRLEHCIQEVDERQTQQLPEEENAQLVIARLMGFDGWSRFSDRLNKRLENTNQHFSALFGEERSHTNRYKKCHTGRHSEFYISLWDTHISANELSRRCQLNEKCSSEIIDILNNFKCSNLLLNLSARGSKRLTFFFPKLLEICLALDAPVLTLKRLIAILSSILKRTAYLELLSENLPLLQHLVDLVSRSDWIAKRLSECPILLDELLYPNSLYQPLQTEDLQTELQQNLLRIDEHDEEQVLDAIRQFKLINELRVAAALLSERLNISQVSRYLTQLAEVIIRAGISHNWKNITAKYGTPSTLKEHGLSSSDPLNAGPLDTGFIVVGYGKLGSEELGFNSDLDLVFLFDQDLSTTTNGGKSIGISRFYTRFAQKLIHFLSTRTSLGVLYEVDMRLRPSGNSGLLISHIDTFRTYQEENAWTWEHQALTRARVIAGGQELAGGEPVGIKSLMEKFQEIRSNVLVKDRHSDELAVDVIDMRNKLRTSFDKSTLDKVDLKQCVGGLVDIEFLSQFLMLCPTDYTGEVDPTDAMVANDLQPLKQKSLPSNTADQIKYSLQRGLITKEDADCLIQCYRKYRNYLNERAITEENTLLPNGSYSLELAQVQRIWNKILLIDPHSSKGSSLGPLT